jgi:hypothetical protein
MAGDEGCGLWPSLQSHARNTFLCVALLYRTPIPLEWGSSSPNPSHEKTTFPGGLVVAGDEGFEPPMQVPET